MFRSLFSAALGFAWLCLGASCSEGPGGSASIEGLVLVQEFDLYGNLFREYPAADARVYLVFGDEQVIGDETRAHYSGRYAFPFLRKGVYTVYAYSDCGTCPGGEEAVTLSIDLGAGENLEAPVLTITAQ